MMNDTTTTYRPPDTSQRRLERARDDRVVAGVAAGIAKHYDVGVGWVRLGFVVTSLFGGAGVLLYLLGWLGLPEEGEEHSMAAARVREIEGARSWLGLGLIVVAAVIVLAGFDFVRPGLLWAAALVLVGVLLYRGDLPDPPRRKPRPGTNAATPLDSAVSEPGSPPVSPDVAASDAVASEGGVDPDVNGAALPGGAVAAAVAGSVDTVDLPPAPAVDDGEAATDDQDGEIGSPDMGYDEVAPPPPPPVPAPGGEPKPVPPRRRRSRLGRYTLATMLIVLGVMSLLHTGGVIDPTARQYVAAAVTTVGLGLVVGAWWGRARTLIFFGILLLPLLAGATLVRVPLDGGFGDPIYRPATVTDVASEYRLVGGDLTLDLGDIELDAGPLDIEVTNAFGQVTVIVPADVAVNIDARVGAGDLMLPGLDANGVDVERSLVLHGEGQLDLDLEVGFGQIRVFRTER